MQIETYDIMYKNEVTHWWYRVRRKIVCDILTSYAKKRPAPLRILDVGCGTGALLGNLQSFGSVEGVDVSDRAIAYCKERGCTRVQQADAASLPFPNGSFDAIVMLDVLEHLKEDVRGCKEIARVLAPGGIAIIAVPAFMFLWGDTDIISQHHRRYTQREIRRCVEEAGLQIQRSTYFNTFLFPAIALARLFLRLFRIHPRPEAEMGGSFGNRLFYYIFHLESLFLPYIQFPFGVSVLVIASHPRPTS